MRRCFDLKFERTLLRKVTEAALIMELFDGLPLDHALPQSILSQVELFTHVAAGIASLHDLGFVHCDLKPNNILIDPAGQIKVIDLGQACRSTTVKERIQGTPDFIAPEQVECQPVTYRTDVFNFGATMYWALTNKKLTTLYTLKRVQNSFLADDHIIAPSSINPRVPEGLSNLILDCVRTNPSRRPSFSEIIQRLDLIHHSLTRNPHDTDLVDLEDDNALVASDWREDWWA